MNMDDKSLREYIQNNILTTAEASVYLQISKARITKLVEEGTLSCIKTSPQGNLFLRADVETYFKKKQMNYNKTFQDDTLYAPETNTRDCVNFFLENRSKLGRIEAIFVFFNMLDATNSNFYRESNTMVFGELSRVNSASFIIRDTQGKEMWLAGCNCGYGGEGPHGTAKILKHLRGEGTLSSEQFNDDYIEKLIWNRKISIISSDDGEWDVTASESSFADVHLGASLYLFRNRLVLLQNVNNFDFEPSIDLLTAYQAFIPNPVQIAIFPNNNSAEEHGYVLYDNNNRSNKTVYNVIITDSSGRQIWLNAFLEDKRNPIKDPSIKEILKFYNFPTDPKTLFNNNRKSGYIMNSLTDWLNITFNNVAEKPLIIDKK